MEFKINSKQLQKILSKVIPAVPSKTPVSLLQNFLFDIKDGLLFVYATDMEISIKAYTNIDSKFDKKFLVPAKLFYETVLTLPDTMISMTFEPNNHLRLTTENGVYSLGYFETEDYPKIPEIMPDKIITFDSDTLKRAFEKTAFAVGEEDMRPAMTGILLDFCDEGLFFVSTDGHRLVKYLNKNINSDLTEQYIIPKKAFQILSKYLLDEKVEVNLTKSLASFKISDSELVTRLISEKYPNYKSVIPLENEKLLIVNRSELISSLRRMLVFASDDNKQVKLNIDSNTLKISIENIDSSSSATEQLDCKFNSEQMLIAFNVFYLNDMITHIDSENLRFKINTPTKACLIEPLETPENEEILMLLMPVRLNN